MLLLSIQRRIKGWPLQKGYVYCISLNTWFQAGLGGSDRDSRSEYRLLFSTEVDANGALALAHAHAPPSHGADSPHLRDDTRLRLASSLPAKHRSRSAESTLACVCLRSSWDFAEAEGLGSLAPSRIPKRDGEQVPGPLRRTSCLQLRGSAMGIEDPGHTVDLARSSTGSDAQTDVDRRQDQQVPLSDLHVRLAAAARLADYAHPCRSPEA